MARALIEIRNYLKNKLDRLRVLNFVRLVMQAIVREEYIYARELQIRQDGQVSDEVVYDAKVLAGKDPTGQHKLGIGLRPLEKALETGDIDLAAPLIFNLLNNKDIGPILLRLFAQEKPEEIVKN